MKLNEKIYYYRKQAKLSQEELAARVGVSRQAVSKWELGEATPELDKLLALARVFGVTTDELLSESEPPEAEPDPAENPDSGSAAPQSGQQFDHAVGWIGRMARRYGWLAGVYIALSGLGVTVVGALARYMFGQMFAVTVNDILGGMGGWQISGLPQGVTPGDLGFSDGMGNMAAGISQTGQIFITIATVILVIGVCIMIAGIVLAAVLSQKGRKNS